ncbi:MAG: HAMP domain-containing histidine kinase [Halobacteriovoraceae bacterium]|nr:HAMP domain-containing histidine kinase [Halobacteriovoraceae bacterium]
MKKLLEQFLLFRVFVFTGGITLVLSLLVFLGFDYFQEYQQEQKFKNSVQSFVRTLNQVKLNNNISYAESIHQIAFLKIEDIPFEKFLFTQQKKVIFPYKGAKIEGDLQSVKLPNKLYKAEVFSNRPRQYIIKISSDYYLMARFGPPMHHRGPPPPPRNHFAREDRPMGPPPPEDRGPNGPFKYIFPIIICVLISIILSFIHVLYLFRKKAKEADNVLTLLHSGDLKARFKTSKSDEVGKMMLKFNEMADEIESLVEKVKETEASRRLLLQELAHDLRTPIASLRSFLETLVDKFKILPQQKIEEFLNLSLKETGYFNRLVEDLLFLSGVNDPKYKNSFCSTSLNELLSEEVNTLSFEEIKVELDLPNQLNVRGDRHLLKRLLRNGITNAISFAASKVKIGIEDQNQNFISLYIEDDGPGINEEEVSSFGHKKYSRKFDEFDKGRISIGLGSVIMAKISELHGGHIFIRNSYEKDVVVGAKLVITIKS